MKTKQYFVLQIDPDGEMFGMNCDESQRDICLKEAKKKKMPVLQKKGLFKLDWECNLDEYRNKNGLMIVVRKH